MGQSDSDGATEAKRAKRSKKSRSPKEDKKRSDKRSSRRQRRRSSSRESGGRRRERYRDLDRPEEEEDYPRYYGDDRKQKNNDRYWSKYPKREEEPVIGTRYYDVEEKENNEEKEEDEKSAPRQRKNVDLLTSKTGGAYIPPAKLRLMQAQITDKTSVAYQRIAWEALKKSIHGHINKVNTSNIKIISMELMRENIVRGRGLLCKSIIQAQAASPTFTNVYAALVSIINSKFPNIGELLLKRLVLSFKRGYTQNNKVTCISATTFIAHLVNQRVAHEILALEILTLLVENTTDDSVEVAIGFLKECGQKLTEVSRRSINAIFEMLRNILHEGKLERRIQYMIEVMFQVRKDGFKDHVAVNEELDLIDEGDQFTHLITFDNVERNEANDVLNVFKFEDDYEENEDKYKALSKYILDHSSSDDDSGSEDGDDDDDDEDEEGSNDEEEGGKVADGGTKIIDMTETNLTALRRTIYLTIQSSLNFEECAHKLMKMKLKPGQEIELCHMFLDCCAEQRTYEKFYGLLGQRFCQINKVYVDAFEQIFKDTHATVHRLGTNQLRNASKFFAHLLFTDAIGWEVMEVMKMNQHDTTSSSRVFIKILFQELSEWMGMEKLNVKLKDPTMQGSFSGLFPRDNPENTRFAINFFTTIGLGGLTDELREHLTNMPRVTVDPNKESSSSSDSSSSSSSSSSSESDSSDSSSSSSDSSSSSSEEEKKKSKKKKLKAKSKKEKVNKEAKSKANEKRRNRRESSGDGRKERKTRGENDQRRREEPENDKRKLNDSDDRGRRRDRRERSRSRDRPMESRNNRDDRRRERKPRADSRN